MDVSAFAKGFKPIIEAVPNFVANTPSSPLFEVKANNAKLLFCGFDLEADYPEVRALKAAIYTYALSDAFNPEFEISSFYDRK